MLINVDSKSISKIYNVIQLSMTLINISNRLIRVLAITQPKLALNLHTKKLKFGIDYGSFLVMMFLTKFVKSSTIRKCSYSKFKKNYNVKAFFIILEIWCVISLLNFLYHLMNSILNLIFV